MAICLAAHLLRILGVQRGGCAVTIAQRADDPDRGWATANGILPLAGPLSLVASWLVSFWRADPGDAWIRHSVHVSMLWYLAAVGVMVAYRLGRDDWEACSQRGRFIRWSWTWGAMAFLLHVAVSFHYFHHWSHAKAYHHVEAASGWGPGIFVSYTFTLLWPLDAGLWWFAARWYASRPAWLGYLLHAFMAFIAFNGTVIFESGAIRWVSTVAWAGLIAMGLWRLGNAYRAGTAGELPRG